MAEQQLLRNIGRLGVEGAAAKERLRELTESEVVQAFAIMLGKWEHSWAWDVEATSRQKSKTLIARYMNRMELGHHLKLADQVSPSNAKLDRALSAVLDRVQQKLGARMYQQRRPVLQSRSLQRPNAAPKPTTSSPAKAARADAKTRSPGRSRKPVGRTPAPSKAAAGVRGNEIPRTPPIEPQKQTKAQAEPRVRHSPRVAARSAPPLPSDPAANPFASKPKMARSPASNGRTLRQDSPARDDGPTAKESADKIEGRTAGNKENDPFLRRPKVQQTPVGKGSERSSTAKAQPARHPSPSPKSVTAAPSKRVVPRSKKSVKTTPKRSPKMSEQKEVSPKVATRSSPRLARKAASAQTSAPAKDATLESPSAGRQLRSSPRAKPPPAPSAEDNPFAPSSKVSRSPTSSRPAPPAQATTAAAPPASKATSAPRRSTSRRRSQHAPACASPLRRAVSASRTGFAPKLQLGRTPPTRSRPRAAVRRSEADQVPAPSPQPALAAEEGCSPVPAQLNTTYTKYADETAPRTTDLQAASPMIDVVSPATKQPAASVEVDSAATKQPAASIADVSLPVEDAAAWDTDAFSQAVAVEELPVHQPQNLTPTPLLRPDEATCASNVTAPSRTELAIVATPDSPGVTGRTARRHRRERLKLAREAALAENKRLLDGM